jgi:hypothetical protein
MIDYLEIKFSNIEMPNLNALNDISNTPYFKHPSSRGNLRIDVSDLPSGVYFVRVRNLVRIFVKE